MPTITDLTDQEVPLDLPEIVSANWGDEIVRQIWEGLSDEQIKLGLVEAWVLEIRDLPQMLADAPMKKGLAGIWEYWSQGCWREYGRWGWNHVIGTWHSSRARRWP